jgi:hypothetical protein
MKRLFAGIALAVFAALSQAATLVPIQLLNPAGSAANQAIVSTGASSAPAWAAIVNSVAGRTGAVTLAVADVSGAAPLASPALTGTPTAPNAAAGTATTQIATTAFAQNAVTGGGNPGAFTTLSSSGNDALLYVTSGAQSIPNASTTTLTGWTKAFDRLNSSFNASTGVFTAPATGYYRVDAQIVYAQAASTLNASFDLVINANSSAVATGHYGTETTSSVSRSVQAHAVVFLTAGQTVIIQAFQNSGGAISLSSTQAYNVVAIQRVP